MTLVTSSSATTHKIFLILFRRSKVFQWRQNRFKILQHIKNAGGGGSLHPPPPPPLVPLWGMTLRVRRRVSTITLMLITIISMVNLSIITWRCYQPYCTCSRIYRRWELFFRNSSWKPFLPVAVSIFVTFKRNFKSLIEIFLDEVFML